MSRSAPILVLLLLAAAAVAQGVRVVDHPDLIDDDRARRVPLAVHLPAGDGPHPLVVLSHGGAGTREAFFLLAQELARQGYLSVAVEHVRSNADACREAATDRFRVLLRQAGGLGRTTRQQRQELFKTATWEALHAITCDPAAVLERPRDVAFAIDRALDGSLGAVADRDAIAVLGHSFGAYTTLVACGARPALDHLVPPIEPGRGLGPDLSDDRIRVGVAMSPQSSRGVYFSPESYATIDRPLLLFSGSEDLEKGAAAERLPAAGRREAFERMPPGDKHLVWLEGADHMAFTFAPEGHAGNDLLPSAAREDAQRIVTDLVVAFLDLHLRGDEEARSRLNAEHARTLTGRVVTGVDWSVK